MEGRRWEQEEICFYKRRFFQVGKAEMVESSRHGKWRGLSAQLPGCERTHGQRKRQQMERPSPRAEDMRLLLELEQQFQKHRLETTGGVGGCGARSAG